MPKVTYDANVFSKHQPVHFPTGFYMSAFVIQELAAGAADNSFIKALGDARRSYEKAGHLLVPTGEDWWLAGKVIHQIQLGRQSKKTGKIPPMPVSERVRLINDVLIARTAKRMGVTVVTYNMIDFEKIRNFCAVQLKHPSEVIVR